MAITSSGTAIAKSGMWNIRTSAVRALYPAKAPRIAPTAPTAAPIHRTVSPETATHAPLKAPCGDAGGQSERRSAGRSFGQLVCYQLGDCKDRQNDDRPGGSHESKERVLEMKPAEMRRPSYEGRRGHGSHTSDDADAEREQQVHRSLSTELLDSRTPVSSQWMSFQSGAGAKRVCRSDFGHVTKGHNHIQQTCLPYTMAVEGAQSCFVLIIFLAC